MSLHILKDDPIDWRVPFLDISNHFDEGFLQTWNEQLSEEYHPYYHSEQNAYKYEEEEERDAVEHAQGHEVVDEEAEERKTEAEYGLHWRDPQVF